MFYDYCFCVTRVCARFVYGAPQIFRFKNCKLVQHAYRDDFVDPILGNDRCQSFQKIIWDDFVDPDHCKSSQKNFIRDDFVDPDVSMHQHRVCTDKFPQSRDAARAQPRAICTKSITGVTVFRAHSRNDAMDVSAYALRRSICRHVDFESFPSGCPRS